MVSMAQHVRQRLQALLQPRRRHAADLRAAAANLEAAAVRARRARAEAAARLDPFKASTTVHQAWARHPGVRAIFARAELRSCPDCAVGADETLEEAAFGYRWEIQALLEELNGLLEG